MPHPYGQYVRSGVCSGAVKCKGISGQLAQGRRESPRLLCIRPGVEDSGKRTARTLVIHNLLDVFVALLGHVVNHCRVCEGFEPALNSVIQFEAAKAGTNISACSFVRF